MSAQELNAMGYDNNTPKCNGKSYTWWRNKLKSIIIGIDHECWLVFKNKPNEITKNNLWYPYCKEGERVEYTSTNQNKLKKNGKAMFILQKVIRDSETNKIHPCISAKGSSDSLELAYEGTSEVKRSKIRFTYVTGLLFK